MKIFINLLVSYELAMDNPQSPSQYKKLNHVFYATKQSNA